MNRYERYKDSGIPWLGEVPEHWEVKRLKFLTNKIVDGAHFTPTYVNEGVHFLRVTDIQEKNIDMEKIKYIPLEEHQELIKRCNPQKGDLLLSKNGTIGISKKIDWNWEFSIFVSLCLIKFNSLISSNYAKYFFDSNSLQEQIFGLIKKNTVINLHLDKIENFWFVLPSLKEQTAIAHYLDTKLGEIDALIDKQQTLLEKLAEQRTAVITHAVTKGLNPTAPMKNSGVEWLGDVPAHWDVKRLKFLGDIILGLTYSPENITNEDNGTLVLRSSNIQNGKLVYEDNVFVNSDIPKRMVTTDKDILICSRNGSRSLIGKCALIEKDGLNQTFGAFMTVYRTPYRKFVYYSLNSEIFKSQLGLFLTSTINQLTTQVLGNFNIAFPPLEEQSSITEYLDNETAKIDRLCETVNQTIGRLKEYRTALITQAVTGKIKVTNE
jgi:putative type I restriction-modification system specificity determinant for hsdM and hsdR (hsdS)